MKIKKTHWLGIIFAFILVTSDIIFLRKDELFFFLMGIAVVIVSLPFLATLIMETNSQKEKNERFLEFARNLAESVKSGTPIGQSIRNMKNKNFGSLTYHVRKLANQITLGIPIS